MNRTFPIQWILLICLATGCFSTTFAEPAPDFFLTSIENQRFISSGQTGPFVVSFFFVNCPPCIREIPALYGFMTKEFPDAPLLFISPLKSDDREKIRAFARRLNVPAAHFYHDPMTRLARRFYGDEQMTFPAIFVIRDGRIVFRCGDFDDETAGKMRELLGRNE